MLVPWQEFDFDLNGSPMHYAQTEAGKPAFVLAHGYSDNGMCWQRVAAALDHAYTLYLPDARGHGRSARIEPGEVVDAAADLAGLICGLKLERPLVGGHSMGASTTANLAARFPEIPRAIVLEDPPWHDAPPEMPKAEPAKKIGDWLDDLLKLGEEEMKAKARRDNPSWDEAEFDAWARSKMEMDLNVRKAVWVQQPAWQEQLRQIQCPVLLMIGDTEKGGIVSEAKAEEARALNPRVQVVKIDGAGHSIRRDRFSAYLVALQKFLNALD